MCSIICSFNKDKFYELIRLNEFRGSFSHSVCIFDPNEGVLYLSKNFGKLDSINDIPNKRPYQLYIGHVQSPTGGLIHDYDRIHPSRIDKTFLYHNGILKDQYIRESFEYHINNGNVWDTKILHQSLVSTNTENLFSILNSIDGSFACLYIIENRILIFRSDAVNLYTDKYLNISSAKFDNCELLPSNIIYEMNFNDNRLITIGKFESLSSPYYFIEEE